jgi:hypothetical protein
MTRLPSVVLHHGVGMDLPAVVEELLVEVAGDGFTLYCCGPKTAPNALVAAYEWSQYVDLLTIRDFDRITTARVSKRGRVDIFAPEVPSRRACRDTRSPAGRRLSQRPPTLRSRRPAGTNSQGK